MDLTREERENIYKKRSFNKESRDKYKKSIITSHTQKGKVFLTKLPIVLQEKIVVSVTQVEKLDIT